MRAATLGLAVVVTATGVIGAGQTGDSRGSSIRFENVTGDADVRFELESGSPSKMFLIESTGGGVALTDFDNDGWLDLYLVNGSSLDDERRGRRRRPNRLYRNDGDGTFTDVTERAGIGGQYWGMGVCTGDVNGDGFDDIYVTNVGPNLLYLNLGDGTFREAGQQSGVAEPSWSSSCALADYDVDGDLDLYVSAYLDFDINDPPERANDGTRCGYRGLLVACGPIGLTPAPDHLYENLGGGTFRDVTLRTGVGRVAPSFGMGVVWGDYDDDGDPDLYVANDEMPNFLFRNDGGRTFVEVALEAGVAVSRDGRAQGSMGVDFGDYDNDADLDLFVTNYSDDYNTLYRNEGNGTFADATPDSGMVTPALPYVGWGTFFVDLDLDGWLDLPVINGHLYPQLDQVAPQRRQLFERRNDIFLGAPPSDGRGYRQRSLLFRNLGNGRFEEVGERSGTGFRLRDALSSRGLAAGDLNNDGLIDLVYTSLDERPSVLLNRTPMRHWLQLRLKGSTSNHSAIGARVTVRTGMRVQHREVKSGGSYQSQGDLRVHVGLDAATRVDEVTVRWPSGKMTTRRDLTVDRVVVIGED